jgi:hypothetical protein
VWPLPPSVFSLYGKSDDHPTWFGFNPADPASGDSTDWSVFDGTLIKYLTVKAASGFEVYEIAGAGSATGFDFSTLGIVNGGGRQPDISHLSFWTCRYALSPNPPPAL